MAGNREAFAGIVEQYQGMVFKVCRKMTNDSDSAADLAQDIFIKVFRSLATFRAESSFSTWLYQIAVRKCLDWRRAQARKQQFFSPEETAEQHAVSDETPEREVLRREERQAVQGIMAELPEPYLTAVRLFYYQERSCQEIAELMGLPVKTVESQLYRARKILRSKGESLR